MRNLITVFAVGLLLAVFSVPASAFNWTYYDFGANYFDEHNNTSDVFFSDYGWIPSPGDENDGGELYDIEGLNFAFDDTYMYVTLTNTSGLSAYSNHYGDSFGLGDIFFGFNGSYFQYAILAGGALAQVSDYDQITDKPGTYYNNAGIRNFIDGYRATDGIILTQGDAMYTFEEDFEANPLTPGDGDTWFHEYRFELADLGFNLYDFETINFSNTIECGNDLLRKDYYVVPEPGTMALIGLGLLGIGARLRRKKN